MSHLSAGNSIKFLLFNPWSLVNKVDKVMIAAEDSGVDIIGLCETWLKDLSNPTTASIKSYGYGIHHTPRSDDRRGGGTAIVFKDHIPMKAYSLTKSYGSFEHTASTIKTETGTTVLFLVLYRPGSMSSVFISEVDDLLSTVSPKFDVLILAGDLNIDFDDSSNKLYQRASDVIASYGLQRKVFEPTHIGGRSLDQIFVYSLKNQVKCDILVDPSSAIGSDHYPVYCTLSLMFEKKYFAKKSYRKLREIDSESFSGDLEEIINSMNISSFASAMSDFKGRFATLLDSHAPLISKSVAVVDTAPWFDKEYRELRKLRRRLEKLAKKPTSGIQEKIAFREASQKCTTLARSKKQQYFSRVIENSSGNPRNLYKMVNRALDRKQENPLPDYTCDMGQLATDFNNFFVNKIKNIRSSMSDVLPPAVKELPQMSLLHELAPTTAEEIKEIIAESGFKCSPADILPLQLLKKHFGQMLPLLVDLVNLSLSSGCVDGVKLADIIPLLKGDGLDPNILKNFRPVSNLLFLGKLIERLVLRRLNDHMSKNGLHIPEQSAYKKNHSTETILVRIWNDLLVASEEKSATVVMMLDLSAAFDTVDHGLLLTILRNEIGLRGTALQWFVSFLTGRSQRIRLGPSTSEEIIIMFGVPQGSVLGPVLFNIYIRSIYSCVQKLNFVIHGYADDHQVCKTLRPTQQGTVLVEDLFRCFETIKYWMSQYFLQMNDAKTQIIVFGPTKVLDAITIRGVNLAGSSIRFINTVKNLGVYMDSALTMDAQVKELKKKCFRSLRNIRKIRFLLSTDQLKQIVNSLVVSCLDYCNVLYHKISNRSYHQLQLIQNACAKAITGKYKHDHLADDLKDLHWLDVRKRVLFKVGLLAYKSVNGLAPAYLQEMFSYGHYGHSLKLIVPDYRLERYGRRAFSYTGPRLLNSLPSHVTSESSVIGFKSKLKTFLFNLDNSKVDELCC